MQPGDTVSRYRILKRDGGASVGERFVAEAIGGQKFFLRVVPIEMDDDGVKRMAQEVDFLRAIDHSGVLKVVEWGRLPRAVWVAQEHVEGTRLSDRLSQGNVSIEFAAAVGQDLASAIAVIHQAGAAVRDITPENVMLVDDGTARILDLGLARAVDGREARVRTQAGTRLGDPSYMAPEYIADQVLSVQSDLYGLGCLIYEMLTGRPPFVGGTFRVMMDQMGKDVPRPTDRNPDVPPTIDELVSWMLQKTPAERPESAADVAAVLGRFLSETLPTDLGPGA